MILFFLLLMESEWFQNDESFLVTSLYKYTVLQSGPDK